MAGYPYTGGVYGGYSDPANNKKKPFIGPRADAAIGAIPGQVKSSPDVGASMVSEAGATGGSIIQRTAKGYPNVGLSTPPRPAPQPSMNIPGDNGQPVTSPLSSPPASMAGKPPQYAANVSFSNPLASGALATRAMRQGKEIVTPSNQSTGTDGTAGANDGRRTYTMGTPGQDGYGRISVRPGNEVGQNARSALSTMPGQRTAQVGNGLTVTGSQDAINRLSAPVGKVDYSSPIYQRYEAENRAKEAYVNREPVQSDSPLIAPPPVAIGTGGWKSRIAANEANSRAYGDYVRAMSSAQGQAAQEKGANYRAELMDRMNRDQNRDQNAIAQQRLEGELALNQARIGTEQINQQKGQMEVDQAKKMNDLNDQYLAEKDPVKQKALGNQLLTMNGKNTKDWQITTREEPLDPANPTLGTTKRPYAVNLNDPNQVIELGAGGGVNSQAPQEAPQSAIDYLKKNPNQAQYFKQKYGYLPQGF